MTPKEKAKELVEKFIPHAHFWVHDLHPQSAMDEEQLENAKDCALICVDEIRLELDNFGNDDGYQFSRVEYWEEVKQEINKL